MSTKHSVTVGQHQISTNSPPFIIAELSANHDGSLERALDIVDAIGKSGAHALKLQTYTADTMTLNINSPHFQVGTNQALWGGRNLYNLYAEAHTPWEWHSTIFERARLNGLVPFSSPFDPSAVALLESLGVPLYKVASAEIVDLPLIREVASTGKPLIISTGMATLAEIDRALSAARSVGSGEVILLACTAAYPASPSDARLANIGLLRSAFDVPVGLSDHTLGIGVSVAAVALGAVCIEKHVTLQRSGGGVDASFSMTPGEMTALSTAVTDAHAGVQGPPSFGPTAAEMPVLRLRRSLHVVKDVKAGDQLSFENVRSVRPAGGLEPDMITTLLGRQFVSDATAGTPLTWELL